MSIRETAAMALVAARGGARVLRDALDPNAMPYRADEVVRPGTLNAMVNDGLLDPGLHPVRISAVHTQPIPSISSNCRNLVLTLEQSGEPGLPDSVFLKLPMESLATHWFFSVINSWQLESHFFRHVAAALPLRTPVTYATRCQGTRFFLMQENLHADPSVELFTNLDMLEGPPLDIVRRCLDAFARLHAHHYGLEPAEREAILPLALHPFLSRSMGPVSKTLNRLALKPCMRKLPGKIPPDIQCAYRDSIAHWDALLEHWFSGPLSLLHGDSHLGNFFVSGDEMGMLDWQAAHWGKGIRDVVYFLNNAVPSDVLAAHERELVDYYVARRAAHGEAIDGAAAWQDYRGFTFHALMTIVVSIGFGALNEEQDALMAEILQRSVATAQRVDYAGWLAGFLQR